MVKHLLYSHYHAPLTINDKLVVNLALSESAYTNYFYELIADKAIMAEWIRHSLHVPEARVRIQSYPI